VREEQHAERPAERGFRRVPAGLDGREQRAFLGGLAAKLAAAGVAAVEDEVGDTNGPIALGALPFLPGAPATLVVPAVVVAKDARGRAWK